MLTIYGGSLGPYTMRVLLQVRAKGLEYEQRPTLGGDSKSAEYLALNPMGRVPAMRHGNFVLPESAVIAEYLEDAFPEPRMLPLGLQGRARARLIVRLVDLYLTRSIHPLYNQMNVALNGGQPDKAVVAASMVDLNSALGYLDHYVAPGPYAVVPAQTLADFALLPYLFFFKIVLPFYDKPIVPAQPNLNAWWVANESTEQAKTMSAEMEAAWQAFRQRAAAQTQS